MISEHNEVLETGVERKDRSYPYLPRKNSIVENELSNFERDRSGREIFRLGVLIKKWQLAVPARVLLYEKRSFLSELLGPGGRPSTWSPPGGTLRENYPCG